VVNGRWIGGIHRANTRRKKGNLKIHVAVNLKVKEILVSLKVTDERIHYGRKNEVIS
jgi:hypothetical protein